MASTQHRNTQLVSYRLPGGGTYDRWPHYRVAGYKNTDFCENSEVNRFNTTFLPISIANRLAVFKFLKKSSAGSLILVA